MGAIENVSRATPVVPRAVVKAQAAVAKPAAERDQLALSTSALSRADQAAYQAVSGALGAADRAKLAALLAKGGLAAKDSQGQSLLANLQAVATMNVPAGAPYTAKEALAQLVGHLADPQRVQQADHNTCGPTTVQYLLLTRQPAEYARLVAGLLGGEGRVKLQGGQELARVGDSLANDGSGRDDLNRLLQAAMIDQGGHLRGRYSNVDDRWHAPTSFWRHPIQAISNKLAGWVGGNFGIGETSEKRLFEQVLGLKAHTIGDVPFTDFLLPKFLRDRAYDEVVKAVAAGKVVAVDIVTNELHDAPGAQEEHVLDRSKLSYSDAMKSHQILITGIADGKVSYRNPWGYETFMSQAEFKSRLQDGTISA
ncbi:MAG: hypothetical protein JWM80_6327 [Cyanobacteria bacterium RYN_339]|nr:hypothetical protein [Cyanobacteria bacterium RYN_339]